MPAPQPRAFGAATIMVTGDDDQASQGTTRRKGRLCGFICWYPVDPAGRAVSVSRGGDHGSNGSLEPVDKL
jgi:hypothetical protein